MGESGHHIEHLTHHLGVKGGGGLVKQHHLGVHGQSAGNGHALLLAARELGWVFVLVGQQAHTLQVLESMGLSLVLTSAQDFDLRQG